MNGVPKRSPCSENEYWLREVILAFERQKTCFIVLYVQVFIVFTRLARAAQPSDISLTPGPCSMTLTSPF